MTSTPNPLDQSEAEILAALGLKSSAGDTWVPDVTLSIGSAWLPANGERKLVWIFRGWDSGRAEWDLVGEVLVGENGLYLACLDCPSEITVEDAAMCQPCREIAALNDAAEADAAQAEYEMGYPR